VADTIPRYSDASLTRDSLAATAAGIGCALLGAMLLLTGARWWTPSSLRAPVGSAGFTARTHAWVTADGFYPAEIDANTHRQFTWTDASASLIFSNLSRAQDYQLSLNVAAPRPPGVAAPTVTVLVDDVVASSEQVSGRRDRLSVDIPSRPAPGAVIRIEAPDTFVPSLRDRRSLGIMVNTVRLEPASGYFVPSWQVLAWSALAIGFTVVGIFFCGGPRILAAGLSFLIVVGFVWLLLLDAAFLGNEADWLSRIGAAVLVMGALVRLARRRWPTVAGLPEWSTALGLVLALSALKLAFFTHPQIARTDAIFQVHRAQLVHRGTYFFTSFTPSPGFEFPYAIGLYVAALPFWSLFPSEEELANLLRGLALAADACVGVVIYASARRQWNDPRPALLGAALWPLTRAPAMALGHANLTNLFGQGLFGIAMGLVAWVGSGSAVSARVLSVAGFFFMLAFLSHFSTLLTGVLLLAVTAAVLLVRGTGLQRRLGIGLLAVTLGAVAVSYTVYYSHFTQLFRATFTRVITRADQASTTSMVASPATKFQRWITEDQFSNDYGLPGVALFISALVGAAVLARWKRREGLTLILAAWAVVWLGATLLGFFSSVELRANLAATPMFVWLAAFALATIAERSLVGRALAAAGALAIAFDGVRVWLMWLGQL
jgi:hypothetical protein